MPFDVISQYFLNPIGLLGFLGLIPLILFYYFRPKPEEMIMPSMQFFSEDEDSGIVQKSWDRLMKNLLLLLHILVVVGIAAALADFSIGEGSPDEAVVVFDRSASMSDGLDDAKSFVSSNLGSSNTLVVVDDRIEVPLEGASSGEVESYLSGIEGKDTETDIAGGLEVARAFDGTFVVASDMKQSVSDRSVEDLLRDIESERAVRLFDTSSLNSWGIVDVTPGPANSSVEIKNFRSSREQIDIDLNGQTHQLSLDAGEVKNFRFSSSETDTVELPADEMSADNSAYLSMPAEEEIDVVLLSDEDNPYLEKVFELIEFTNIRTLSPSVDFEPDADVYIIGESDRIMQETVDEIESEVEDGAAMVVFGQESLVDLQAESLPEIEGSRSEQVELIDPYRIHVGETRVYNAANFSGESISNPEDAMIRSSFGRGEVLFYNIHDEDFRYDFLYPVFWQDLIQEMADRRTIEDLNVRTGETINETRVETPGGETVEGEVRVDEAGFYNTSGGVYAANLASEDESEPHDIGIDVDEIESETDQSLKTPLILILVSLLLAELFYLRRIGEV